MGCPYSPDTRAFTLGYVRYICDLLGCCEYICWDFKPRHRQYCSDAANDG